MTNKNISMLDNINKCNFTIGELVEGVRDWLNDVECEEPNMDSPIKLEQFVLDLVRNIGDNKYCREMWASTHGHCDDE